MTPTNDGLHFLDLRSMRTGSWDAASVMYGRPNQRAVSFWMRTDFTSGSAIAYTMAHYTVACDLSQMRLSSSADYNLAGDVIATRQNLERVTEVVPESVGEEAMDLVCGKLTDHLYVTGGASPATVARRYFALRRLGVSVGDAWVWSSQWEGAPQVVGEQIDAKQPVARRPAIKAALAAAGQ
jgi:hypothetical protein